MTNYTVGAKRRNRKRNQPSDPPAYHEPKPSNEPTPERMAKGDFEEGSQLRVFRDKEATPLRRAYNRDAISLSQCEAGEWYEEQWRIVNGSNGPRSCLDWQIPGCGEPETERQVKAAAAYRDVVQRMGMQASAVVTSVAVDHEPTGDSRNRRFALLVDGLNVAAKYKDGK